MRILPILSALALAACVTDTPQPPPSSFLASNLITARAVPGSRTEFEVLPYRGAGAYHYWCAAGEYVYKGMRLPTNTRVYLREPASNGQPMRFTIDPSAELIALGDQKSETDYNIRVSRPGENRRAMSFGPKCDPVVVPFWF